MKKKIFILMLVVLMTIGVLAGCGGGNKTSDEQGESTQQEADSQKGEEDKQLKVALVTEGAVNDGGWNASALQGLKKIEEKYNAETSYTEKVAPANMVKVIRTYARQGYDIIYGHGFQFDEPMKKVAQEFPDTKFITVNGSSYGENLYSTNFKFGELGYFTGLAAGMMTKSDKVGVVAAMEAPTVVADVDTFKQGVSEVNPDAKVAVSYIGSWSDIPKAKEAAKSQLSDGADVILVMGNSFSIGVFQACEEAGAYAIGWVTDQNFMAPETIITSGLQSVESLYMKMADLAVNDKLEPKVYTFGIKDGAQDIAPFIDSVPQEVVDKVQKALQDYKEGKLTLDLKY